MELQYKQQTLHNNFMGASYASGGLQGHTWEFQWGPQGLEQAIKRVGMNPVITQNFSTDPMGRILSMTYNGPTYGGELFFHYDVQGNTSLLTDSNGQAVASFRYDLHSGKLVEHWNPSNLELVNLKNARQGSVTLTSAIGYLPDWGIDLTVQPWRPIIARNDWGFINVRHDSTEPGDDDEDDEKDCGEDSTTPPFLGYICPYAKYYYYAYQEQDDYYSHASTNMCPPHAPFLICYGVYEDEDGNRESDSNYFINTCPSYYLPKEVVIDGKTWRLVGKECFCSSDAIL